MQSFLRRLVRFYLGFFFIALVIGRMDYDAANYRADLNDRSRPTFCLPGHITTWDGGTHTWIGLGYILTRRNQIHGVNSDPDHPTSNCISGWELRAWPILRLPLIGTTLFEVKELYYYQDLEDFFDLRTAGTVTVFSEEIEPMYWELAMIAFGLSLVGFGLLFGLSELLFLGYRVWKQFRLRTPATLPTNSL